MLTTYLPNFNMPYDEFAKKPASNLDLIMRGREEKYGKTDPFKHLNHINQFADIITLSKDKEQQFAAQFSPKTAEIREIQEFAIPPSNPEIITF